MLSRVANSLYWMFRYIERAENIARIVDAGLRMALTRTSDAQATWSSVVVTSGTEEGFREKHDAYTAATVSDYLLRDGHNPSSVLSCIEAARSNARMVRTALTREAWESVNEAWMVVRRVLATPVALWAGWPFFERAWRSFVNRSPNMFTLIGLGVGAAYLYSLVATLDPDLFPSDLRMHGVVPTYFDTAVVITALVLLGQVMELRARGRTNSAIRGLLGLAPRTARVMRDGQDVDVALVDHYLAVVGHGRGDLAGALACEERALAVFTRAFAADHPRVVDAGRTLASIRSGLGL